MPFSKALRTKEIDSAALFLASGKNHPPRQNKKAGFCLPDFFGIITAVVYARQLRASVGAAGKTAGHLNIFAKTGTMSFITIFDVLMQMS